jgi:hypothetical protein
LITRLESYTKDAIQDASSAHAATPADSRRMWVGRDVTLGLCAVGYLALVLFDDVESPLLSLALIFLVACALIQPHVRHR